MTTEIQIIMEEAALMMIGISIVVELPMTKEINTAQGTLTTIEIHTKILMTIEIHSEIQMMNEIRMMTGIVPRQMIPETTKTTMTEIDIQTVTTNNPVWNWNAETALKMRLYNAYWVMSIN